MKTVLHTLAGTAVVLMFLFGWYLVALHPALGSIFLVVGVILFFGYIVGWFLWGQKPPRI